MATILTISEALAAIAPALAPTPRFAEVNVKLENGVMSAFNGLCSAWAPIALSYETVVVNAARLKSNWGASATMSVADKFVTIKRGKTQVRLLKQPTENFMIPVQLTGGQIFSMNVRNAVFRAAQFMSENALHLWANTVSINEHGAVATNNQIVVKFPVESPFHVTLPKWAVEAIRREGPAPLIAISDNQIKFEYPSGVVIQASRLDVDMPEKLNELANSLLPAIHPVGTAKSDLAEIKTIEGKFVTIANGTMSIVNDLGEAAETPTSLTGNIKMSVATLEQVLDVATHLDIDESALKLNFSGNGLLGIAMGCR